MTDWEIMEMPEFDREFDRGVKSLERPNWLAPSTEEISAVMDDLINRYRDTGLFSNGSN